MVWIVPRTCWLPCRHKNLLVKGSFLLVGIGFEKGLEDQAVQEGPSFGDALGRSGKNITRLCQLLARHFGRGRLMEQRDRLMEQESPVRRRLVSKEPMRR
jgi:hypothetical protein